MQKILANQIRVNTQRGISLIEVLIALLLISIGLLGMASLQANSLKFNRSAYDRSVATQLAYDITDRMRANRAGALAGDYDLEMTDDHTATGTVAEQDLTAWIGEINSQLSNGQGEVVWNDTRFTINVQWDEVADQGNTMTFTFETEL